MTKIPEDFEKRMKSQLGDEFIDFLSSYDEKRPRSLRFNSLKLHDFKDIDRFSATKAKSTFSFISSPVEWCPEGFYYDEKARPGTHPYHEAGLYYIQDASAMYPAQLLAVSPGDRVLDLCAAPGGKATQIGAKLCGRGLLVANEIIPSRAKILSENIERFGIENAVVTCEAPQDLSFRFPSFFDKILVDAPCSGEGMFRKNPEAANEWSLENVQMCAKRQRLILDEACKMLAVGGSMVYSTCTFSTQENEEMIEAFLERHREFELVEEKRLWPHRIKGEGHYAAKLVKKDESTCKKETFKTSRSGLHKTSSKKKANHCSFCTAEDVLKQFLDFSREIISSNLNEIICGKIPILFGDNLYLLPEEMPSVSGIKVVRPGLHLCTIKKNRLEPSHALAMAMSSCDAKNIINVCADDRMIREYFSGNVLNIEKGQASDGWVLVCVDGYSCGWGKASGNTVKNHYPKGLRKTLLQA